MTQGTQTPVELALKLRLSRAAGEKLAQRAAEKGTPLDAYASELIEQAVTAPTLDELLAPLRAEVEASGMSDDELSDLLEKARHETWSERQSVRVADAKRSSPRADSQ